MRSRLPLAFLFLAAATPWPAGGRAHADAEAALSDPCVAASCLSPFFGPGRLACGFGPVAYRCGQTFTPRFTGVLREVRIGLWSQYSVNAIVEIRPTVNGVPTGAIVAEAVVPGAPYAGDALVVASFPAQSPILVQGIPYALTLRAAGSTVGIMALAEFPPCRPSTGTGLFVTSEDDGRTWTIYPPRDRSFIYEVCVDASTPTLGTSWGRLKAFYR